LGEISKNCPPIRNIPQKGIENAFVNTEGKINYLDNYELSTLEEKKKRNNF